MPRPRSSFFFISFLASLSIPACSGADSSSGFAPGTERGRCRADGTCEQGLVCLSDTCVNPNGSPDASSGGSTSGTGATSNAGGMNGTGGGQSTGAGSGTGGTGPVCNGAHPNVSGSLRYCDPGDCYCTDPFDTCFPAGQVATCCTGNVDCGGDAGPDAGPGGVDCSGQHPIIGPPRTCSSGYCLCSDSTVGIDSCYPQDVASTCCPPSVTLQCVP